VFGEKQTKLGSRTIRVSFGRSGSSCAAGRSLQSALPWFVGNGGKVEVVGRTRETQNIDIPAAKRD